MSKILDQVKTKMQAAIEHFKEELRSIRTGRANPGMVEGVQVDVYGNQMRIKEIATINSPEPRMIVITPFDPNNKGSISKAIEKANLGFNPMVDGNIVRIKIPPMDDNMRKEMIKLCHKRNEDTKVRIREGRREGNDTARKQKGEGELSEDDVKRLEKQIQELTDKFCKESDDLCHKKEKEISAV
jgi:ribosome recycling factor